VKLLEVKERLTTFHVPVSFRVLGAGLAVVRLPGMHFANLLGQPSDRPLAGAGCRVHPFYHKASVVLHLWCQSEFPQLTISAYFTFSS
jgi:hypothetical protein